MVRERIREDTPMRWLAVIIILIIVVGALGLRLARNKPGGGTAGPSHRLDESVIPPATPGFRPDLPSTSEASYFAGTGSAATFGEPGSDFATEPEIAEDETPEPGTDPPADDGRPTG
jgi:hypothetical protein